MINEVLPQLSEQLVVVSARQSRCMHMGRAHCTDGSDEFSGAFNVAERGQENCKVDFPEPAEEKRRS